MGAPPWIKGHPGAWIIAVYVQPGASKTEVVGEHADTLKIRIAAPPVDGKANDALLRWFASHFREPLKCFELHSGQSQRVKKVKLLLDLDEGQVIGALAVAR